MLAYVSPNNYDLLIIYMYLKGDLILMCCLQNLSCYDCISQQKKIDFSKEANYEQKVR